MLCRLLVQIHLLFLMVWLTSCDGDPNTSYKPPANSLFSKLEPAETGIEFQNTLHLKEDFDVFRYRNYYNGGGVGIGDFNNDGLADVYLTSNMGDNKLFLNKGNWKFEDITERAGVKGSKVWSTGVSIADVNGDGFLDIYVCNAGDVKGGNRENELFINNGDLTFTDKAHEYGLDDKGYTTHAAFFDFDKDGDLDCYVLNNSSKPVSSLGYRNLRNERDTYGGHRLYRNDNNVFKNISEAAGIYGSIIGFGLGVTVGDVNNDGWPDIYVSNDFYERDYLYVNQKDGTFSEEVEKYFGHISMFSMGADLADLNNDGYPEIFSTDMLPEDMYRLKTLIAFESWDVYQIRLKNDYYHQFMRNMLQKNNGDGTFSEVGNLAGVEATDWSWGALIADFNNDSYKEIFVCNGIHKDLINQDFIDFLGSEEQRKVVLEGKKADYKMFTEKMPSNKLSNYMYTRVGDWQYKNVADKWGLAEPSFSNGAAYGDLDNDGDLDLIVNNVNQDLFVYRNQSREQSNTHYLGLSFKGFDKNTFALGTAVRSYAGKEMVYLDHMPIRGFQSSMDYKMIIGLGDKKTVDSLVIVWPDLKKSVLKNVSVDQNLVVDHKDAKESKSISTKYKPLLMAVNDTSVRHIENDYSDFDRDRLIYFMESTKGPGFAKADLNKDGLDDVFLGGSMSSPGRIFIQQQNGSFRQTNTLDHTELSSDENDGAFFDADGDNDLDLYVVTGGSEQTVQSASLQDALYLNQGIRNGIPIFEKSKDRIPSSYQSGNCVRPADFDGDGDIDLFVGTNFRPSYFGLPCDQVLLVNDGKGFFTDMSNSVAPEFKNLGMVTDANWADVDKNGKLDLVMVGEWMPVTVFLNDGHTLKKKDYENLVDSNGWWNCIKSADIDEDGDVDFVLGNQGLNTKFRPRPDSALTLYVNDFDKNGSVEQIFTYNTGGKAYTITLRQEMVKQMSSLKKKFLYYKDYASKSLDQIFEPAIIESATKLTYKEPHSLVLVNNGSDFSIKYLPTEAQISPVYGIYIDDINGDSHQDLVLGGNMYRCKPEVGRCDALHGLVLVGNGNGNFEPLSSNQSGVLLQGEVRHVESIKTKEGKRLAFIRNNDLIKFYSRAK